jgi:microcystin degradation protein MlrC
MKRILLAGLFHETHTFLEGVTPLDAFQIRRASDLLTSRGDGSPLAGALEIADQSGWDIIPAVDVRATPSATAADSVVETFWNAFQSTALREQSRGIDGIYLVLHGAMVSESHADVEAEIVARIRTRLGMTQVPICGVLDLHGNISREFIEQTNGFVAYRCNPHTDACEAARAGARLLDRILTTGKRPTCVWAHPKVMWPPTGTGTDDDPMRTLAITARQIESSDDHIYAVNVFAGFSFADVPDAGVSFSAITFGDPDTARRQLSDLAAWTEGHCTTGNRLDTPLTAVMPEICQRAARGAGPILIVEPADNIGGGAPGDATTVLRALIEHQVQNAAVVINDPQTVAQLQSLPIGARKSVAIGGKSSRLTDGPIELEVELLSRSDGRFELEDRNSHLASMSGVHVDMGPCAVVRHAGVRILLTSRKTPPFDLGQLRSQGLEPEQLSVIGVKAAVAHRRAYDPIARASYWVATPGPCTSDLRSLPYRHVRRPIFPLDEI